MEYKGKEQNRMEFICQVKNKR